MNYVLKKTNLKNGLYLQIYKSEYDPSKRNNRNSLYKTLGYVDKLITDEIKDPVAYYKEVVAKMNADQKFKEAQEQAGIDESKSPEVLAGYSPIKVILEKLGVGRFIKLYQRNAPFRFDLYKMMCDLISARLVQPCSKYKTYLEVLPKLGHDINYSYDQILDACEFIGQEYDFFTSLMASAIKSKYGNPTETVFFDCTNFYFEIDREDELRRKGPSKEHRVDPIVGMGLLLNNDMIPINMKMYPGNQSEVRVINEVINNMKEELDITGRTIRVADKGLNCALNIFEIDRANEGYIFSKSVKKLDGVEKTWVLSEKDVTDEAILATAGWKFVKDSTGKTIYRYKEYSPIKEEKIKYTLQKGTVLKNGSVLEKNYDFFVKEKRILTYNPSLAIKQKYEIDKLFDKAIKARTSEALKDNYGECSKYLILKDKDGKKVKPDLNIEKKDKDKELCGYNLLVTSELNMPAQKIYEVYHQLWRIEETFRTLKSQLDARPVYLQKANSIIGHFVINFMAVQLLRLMQFYELKGKYGTEELCNFIREFRLAKSYENLYLNLDTISKIHSDIAEKFKIPVNKRNLSKRQFEQLKLS